MKDFQERQKAITFIKKTFTEQLEQKLGLMEVSAPLLTDKSDGVQDGLNDVERPVSVSLKALPKEQFEIIQSLAKWKRQILGIGKFKQNTGIYTYMQAVRADEETLDTTHSAYVDQWDWECVISEPDRHLDFLKETVKKVYDCILTTHLEVCKKCQLHVFLPKEITFIHTQELLDQYPNLSRKEKEDEACKKYGAVFLIGIGHHLENGVAHDGRAPDYDDWSTPNDDGYFGLNGDILVWNPALSSSFEISSMGIRVDSKALMKQLGIKQQLDKIHLPFHQSLLEGELPLSIGGGIGISRLVMFMLQKKHIGQVQFGAWSKQTIAKENLLTSFDITPKFFPI